MMDRMILSAMKCALLQDERQRMTSFGLQGAGRTKTEVDFDRVSATEDRAQAGMYPESPRLAREIVMERLKSLVAGERELVFFVRVLLENVSIKAAADDLQISHAAARARVSRMRQRLGIPGRKKNSRHSRTGSSH